MMFALPGTEIEASPKATKYNVVRILNVDGSVSFAVLTTADLKSKPKELKSAYTAAVKAYNADKKANKGKTELKKPTKPKLKKLKSNIKTEEKAEEILKAFEEKWAKALAKAKAKAEAKKAPKTNKKAPK